MESSSSSSSNKLQNSYFFYGTHPLKVPNILIHANSTTSLSTSPPTENSNHLSLNLTNNNHHGFSSTKSLNNLTQSHTDDDGNNEVNKQKKEKKNVLSCFIICICHCPNNIIISININI
jgi:hypothetical protein